MEKQTLLKEIEESLLSFLPKEEGLQKAVMEAVNYSVLAGGKRLRPMLMLLCFRMFGGKDDSVWPFMAAIEMIHTYSLVHDDLPAMDNDEYRRGKKTTHALYGEAMGVLAGDALLNLSMETALTAFLAAPENKHIPEALAILYRASGIYGMIGGQTVDVETEEDRERDAATLDFIYALKTGALLSGAMTVGATLAGAGREKVERIRRVGDLAGKAFQIRDDILDVEGTFEELGKPIGSDEKNHKVTFVSLYGLKKAEEEVAQLTKEAMELLDSLEEEHNDLKELLLSLVDRRK